MTVAEYRANTALNFSWLKEMLVSPWHFHTAKEQAREETIDMRLGTHVHQWWLEGRVPEFVLQPETYTDEKGKVKPWHNGANVCKAWVAEQTLPILTADEAERQTRMIRALQADKLACDLLEACDLREHAILFDYRGVQMKALLDAASVDRWLILDLKKTTDASPRGFGKAITQRAYAMQATIYKHALQSISCDPDYPAWRWQVVEDSGASACVAHYALTPELAELGQRQLDRCIDRYLACMESGEWPAYGSGLLAPEVSAYALTQ